MPKKTASPKRARKATHTVKVKARTQIPQPSNNGVHLEFQGAIANPLKREQLRQELRKLAAEYGFTLTRFAMKQEP